MQLPLLVAYSSRIDSSLNAFERLASSFAKIVPGALAGHATHPSGLTGPDRETKQLKGVQGLGSLCKALVSVRWVMKAMEEWGDEMVGRLRMESCLFLMSSTDDLPSLRRL